MHNHVLNHLAKYVITADHLIPRDEDGQGIDNDKVALVVKDHFSGWIDIYPAACKSADEVVQHLNGVKIICLVS